MTHDPLAPRTDVERELFNSFAKVSAGKPVEEILGACMNLIANCLRQNYGLRREVEAKMTEMYGKNMELVLQHYDPVSGRRRSVIPFDQVIRPATLVDRDRF